MKIGPDIRLAALDPVTLHLKNGRVINPDEVKQWYAHAAERVKKWRKAHDAHGHPLPLGRDDHMSQIDFARKAGVSVGCVQGVENGTHQTRAPQLLKIARAIDLHSVKELIAPLESDVPAPVPVTDDRYKDLYPDDLEVAHMYRTADGPLKTNVRRMLSEYHLRARASLEKKEALRLPSEATFRDQRSVVDRRSGTDRRSAADRESNAADRRRSGE